MMEIKLTTDLVKAQAKIIKEFLKGNNIEVSHSFCLEVISKIYGQKDWNNLSAALKNTD